MAPAIPDEASITGDTQMTVSQNPKSRRLSARRLALLGTTILGLSAGALIVVPSVLPNSHVAFAQSQNVARPVGFADIVERVKPAVISVRVKMESRAQPSTDESPFPPGSDMDQFFRRNTPEGAVPAPPRSRGFTTGQGSGFFISPDGFAVTNNHVVDKATNVQVTTDDGKSYPAKVIGVDQRTDLALIKVEGGNFPYVKLSDKSPRIGDWVLAVGNPFGLGGTVTAGIVSARGRDIGSGPYDDFIQIDAPVNKGNSGGPTFDVEGNVIGVNTAIFSPSGGSVGIAFAIPSDTVKTVIAQLKDKGSVVRGWIGVQVQPVTAEVAQSLGLKKAEGALVAEPQPNGPAATAGIESGDVITSVNGLAVKDSRDLARRIGGLPPGASVKLVVIHKGTEKNMSLTLGELPAVRESRNEPTPGERDTRRRRDRDQDLQRGPERDDRGEPRADRRDREDRSERFSERRRDREDRSEQRADRGGQRGQMPRLGLSLAPGQNTEGVTIAAVEPDSPAAELGFRSGDVILDVGGKTVSEPADVRKALFDARTEGKRNVMLRIKSQEGTRFITIPLERA
jgi:serine protease Do